MPWRIIAGPVCLHARDYTPHSCMAKAWFSGLAMDEESLPDTYRF